MTLNPAQQYRLDATLGVLFDSIKDTEKDPDVLTSTFLSMLVEQSDLTYQQVQDLKQWDVSPSVRQIQDMMQHPCPQNRSYGVSDEYDERQQEYVIRDPATVHYFDDQGAMVPEPRGLLGLSVHNDMATSPVTKEDVVEYVKEAVVKQVQSIEVNRDIFDALTTDVDSEVLTCFAKHPTQVRALMGVGVTFGQLVSLGEESDVSLDDMLAHVAVVRSYMHEGVPFDALVDLGGASPLALGYVIEKSDVIQDLMRNGVSFDNLVSLAKESELSTSLDLVLSNADAVKAYMEEGVPFADLVELGCRDDEVLKLCLGRKADVKAYMEEEGLPFSRVMQLNKEELEDALSTVFTIADDSPLPSPHVGPFTSALAASRANAVDSADMSHSPR